MNRIRVAEINWASLFRSSSPINTTFRRIAMAGLCVLFADLCCLFFSTDSTVYKSHVRCLWTVCYELVEFTTSFSVMTHSVWRTSTMTFLKTKPPTAVSKPTFHIGVCVATLLIESNFLFFTKTAQNDESYFFFKICKSVRLNLVPTMKYWT